jgi:hypothetical protein
MNDQNFFNMYSKSNFIANWEKNWGILTNEQRIRFKNDPTLELVLEFDYFDIAELLTKTRNIKLMLSILTRKRNEQIRFEEWLEEKQALKQDAHEVDRILSLPQNHEIWRTDDENEDIWENFYKGIGLESNLDDES